MDPLPLPIVTHPLYLKHPDEFLKALSLAQEILHTDRDLPFLDIQKKCLTLQPELNQEILTAAIRLVSHFILYPPSRSGLPADDILWDADIDL